MGIDDMFEVFSRGYYLGRLYVTPTDADHAFMQRESHERVNEELFVSNDGIERLDQPLIMKLRNSHFPVHADESIPEGTLAVPRALLRETDIVNPPTLTEVLLARRTRAVQLRSLWGTMSLDTDSAGT